MAYAPNILVKACDSQDKNLTTRIIYYIKNKSNKQMEIKQKRTN